MQVGPDPVITRRDSVSPVADRDAPNGHTPSPGQKRGTGKGNVGFCRMRGFERAAESERNGGNGERNKNFPEHRLLRIFQIG